LNDGADHRNFHVDDTLCHNVARVLTSLIESKNAHAGIHAYVNTNRQDIVSKFFESIGNDAMLFIYLELIGASEDKRMETLELFCREYRVMDEVLYLLSRSDVVAEVKNSLEAIVTISSCFSDSAEKLSAIVTKAAISSVVTAICNKSEKDQGGTVCRLAALTHLIILETDCVTDSVADQLPAIRLLLQISPLPYCEERSHQVFETPVGSVRIAVIELLVAFIDKVRDARVEKVIPGLVEEVMVFFCEHTGNDFIGIEMVQLVRRVLASSIQPRIQQGLLTTKAMDGLLAALSKISNIWELGHLRCIVKDLMAKRSDDTRVATTMEAFTSWSELEEKMSQAKEGVVRPDGKRRRGDGSGLDIDLPVGPLSPLAAGALRKTLGKSGAVVHEDTPRKVMYVASKDVERGSPRSPAPKPPTPVPGGVVAKTAGGSDGTARALF
jgi:hypothetical protein